MKPKTPLRNKPKVIISLNTSLLPKRRVNTVDEKAILEAIPKLESNSTHETRSMVGRSDKKVVPQGSLDSTPSAKSGKPPSGKSGKPAVDKTKALRAGNSLEIARPTHLNLNSWKGSSQHSSNATSGDFSRVSSNAADSSNAV